jgi:hypothetical protein
MSWNPGWSGAGGSGSSASGILDYGLIPKSMAPDVRKAPTEVIRVDFSFASRLGTETISSISFTAPDGMTLGASSGSGSVRSVLVSEGDSGRIYRVVATAVTSGGQTLVLTRRVFVLEG